MHLDPAIGSGSFARLLAAADASQRFSDKYIEIIMSRTFPDYNGQRGNWFVTF